MQTKLGHIVDKINERNQKKSARKSYVSPPPAVKDPAPFPDIPAYDDEFKQLEALMGALLKSINKVSQSIPSDSTGDVQALTDHVKALGVLVEGVIGSVSEFDSKVESVADSVKAIEIPQAPDVSGMMDKVAGLIADINIEPQKESTPHAYDFDIKYTAGKPTSITARPIS
jgi:hypothetical protein